MPAQTPGSRMRFRHCPPSEYAEVRVLRVARRAIRQFYRENVKLHKGQVITSETQLAAIFGQRVVDKVRATIHGRRTALRHVNAKEQQRPGTACTGPLWLALMSISQTARPGRFVLYCFKKARWKLPARIGYLTFNVNSLIRLGRLRLLKVPQSSLTARYGSSGNTHLRRQKQNSLRRLTSLTPTRSGTMSCTGVMVRSPWSRSTNAQVSPSYWIRVFTQLTGLYTG